VSAHALLDIQQMLPWPLGVTTGIEHPDLLLCQPGSSPRPSCLKLTKRGRSIWSVRRDAEHQCAHERAPTVGWESRTGGSWSWKQLRRGEVGWRTVGSEQRAR